MLRKEITLAARHLGRHAGFSAVLSASLALGLAACILIGSYVGDELAYGSFHEDADRIYRVLRREQANAGDVSYTSDVSGAVAPALLNDFPEIELSVRLLNWGAWVRVGDKILNRPFCQADVGVIDLFDVAVLGGADAADLLEGPDTVLLSESTAHDFFGDADPIGHLVTVEGGVYDGDYNIVGVFRDQPPKAHQRFDFLTARPHSSASASGSWVSAWKEWLATTSWRPFQVYIRLAPGADRDVLQSRLPAFVERHMGAEVAANNTYVLQRLSRIRLYSNKDFGLWSEGDIETIHFIVAIGAIVMFISMFNYVNMATARSTLRAREVGQRKVLGARPVDLAVRYLLEGFLHGLVSTAVAFGIAVQLLPWMGDLVRRNLVLGAGDSVLIILFALAGPVVGSFAAVYPAIILARLSPISALKGNLRGSAVSVLVRRGLVVLQLVVTVGTIASAIVVYQQIGYMREKDMGYDSESLVVLGIFDDELMDRYKAVKQAFLQHPGVQQATACWPHPAGWVEHHIVHPEGEAGETWRMQVQGIDEHFLETLGIELVEGRDLREDGRLPRQTRGAADSDEFLLNETAVHALGWDDPVGRSFRWNDRVGTVVGVIRDFHSKSMHSRLEPMFLCRWIYHTLILRISNDDLPGTIRFLEETWKQFVPNQPADLSFMDKRIEGMYHREVLLGRLYTVFGGLAVLIATVGLVGLAAFTTVRRRKEIGIRKVLGAKVSQILRLLVWDVCRLVIIANLAAWPITFFFMTNWLHRFAYQTDLGPLPFAVAGAFSLALACGAVSYAAYRVATMNPVEALHTE